jgi:thiol-disulfide isomerase/thioredoxin
MKTIGALAGVMFMSTVALGAVQDPVVQARKSGKPVVVFFTKSRCPYCVWLRPMFAQLQSKSQGISFLVVDVGTNGQYFKSAYGFSTVPTVIYFDSKGQEVGRHGSNNKRMTLSQMQNYLNRTKV